MFEKNTVTNFNNDISRFAHNSAQETTNFFLESQEKLFKEFKLEIDWNMLEKNGLAPQVLPATASVRFST